MEEHAKLLEQRSPEAHFSKMTHTGKKSISLSLDELHVLSVGFNEEAQGEGGACTHSHTLNAAEHVRTHLHTHAQPEHARACKQEQAAITVVDPSLNVELGHTVKATHTQAHSTLKRYF